MSRRRELDIVSDTAPPDVPPSVRVHRGLRPNAPELKALYRAADALIHPTTADLSGWVVLEAGACSCPAVVTATGGVPELVEDGRTGFVVPVGDDRRLGDAIERLVSDRSAAAAMGEHARRRIEERFDARTNVPRILDLMKRSADAARARA
mgnify:CR=1 FL=1